MNKILRVGIIGAGVLGSYHVEKCCRNKTVVCSGVYDLDPAKRTSAVERFRVVSFDNVDRLIEASDALIIATPCSTHAEVARRCASAGRHMLIEKPLARNAAEATDLLACATQAGVMVRVGHSEFYNAAFNRLYSYAPEPRFIEIHRLAEFSLRGTDVSVVQDLMVHDIHLLLRLCGQDPVYETIMATGVSVISGDIDIANVRCTFPSGCVANITTSRISTKRMRKLRLFQRDNYFSVDLGSGLVERYRFDPTAKESNRFPISFSNETVEPVDALEAEQADFFAAVNGTGTGGVSGEEGLRVLKVTDAILSKMRATIEDVNIEDEADVNL